MPRFWSPSHHVAPLALAASLLWGAAHTAAWAARDFTPQAGTWVISEELNGQPGRGLAIDVQGNTFVMQVFGYEKNGDATFYTATGQMEGDSVTAPLMRYQGGRSFGSDARDAVEDKSLGNVTVKFTNGLQGTVKLPGEPEMAIERFQAYSQEYVDKYLVQRHSRSYLVAATDESEQTSFFTGMTIGKSAAVDGQLRLSLSNRGGSSPVQYLLCQVIAGKEVFACENNDKSGAAGESFHVQSMRFRITNVDVQGTVNLLENGVVQQHMLQGIALSAGGGVAITGCASFDEVYVGDLRNCRPASAPSSGTWAVADELLGKPGRGIAIDVQNGLVLTQVFNYLPNGSPTFHMGSGQYQGIQAQFPINRYGGGRWLGGPAASGSLVDATGDMSLRFAKTLDNQAFSYERTQGFVQFPGESVKRIVRMALEPGSSSAQGLLGQWWMSFSSASGYAQTPKFLSLTTVDGEAVVSADGSVHCTRPELNVPQRVKCDWNNAGEIWSAYFYQEANNRSYSALQVRDRHGNLMGLGNVPLD